MPNSYRIDRDRRVVFLTRTHRSTGPEFTAFIHRVVTDPAFEPGMRVLDDRRLAEAPPDTPDLKLAISQLQVDRDRLAGTRWAVVVAPRQPAIVGMYNMFSVLIEELGVEMRQFLTLDEARRWLAIE